MDRTEAGKIYSNGKEATILALLELAQENIKLKKQLQQLVNQKDSLSTPSGMKPVYEKPCSSKRGKKKRGHKWDPLIIISLLKFNSGVTERSEDQRKATVVQGVQRFPKKISTIHVNIVLIVVLIAKAQSRF
jgi:hypothetical protein